MKGQFFALFNQTPQGVNIRTGVVKSQVGAERWLLEFKGKNYSFSNVFSSEQLERFAFFNTPAEQQAFIDDLIAQNQQQQSPPPGIEIAPPEVTQ